MESGLLVWKLDGLLTETRRSIDWKDYWRKWVFCWRKQDGLLTETGWCVDGNWMVNDENWSVYWWKEWSLLMEAV